MVATLSLNSGYIQGYGGPDQAGRPLLQGRRQLPRICARGHRAARNQRASGENAFGGDAYAIGSASCACRISCLPITASGCPSSRISAPLGTWIPGRPGSDCAIPGDTCIKDNMAHSRHGGSWDILEIAVRADCDLARPCLTSSRATINLNHLLQRRNRTLNR
jgi:hypothetical protein